MVDRRFGVEKSLVEMLKEYASSGAIPMHMPGHKRNPAFNWLMFLGGGLDITEIHGFDDLNDPEGIFLRLGERAADLWGADTAIPMVNGGTGCVLTAVYTVLGRGGEMLMARNCHRSVYNAGELWADDIHFVLPEISDRWGICGSVSPEAVERALIEHPNVKLVVITSPTYEGVLSDVAAIARVCGKHGAILLVDEAHGAHLGFGRFPERAISLGADLAVDSLHKTLPSLTQTALLLSRGDAVDCDELRKNAAAFQSSSPSYILSASIDGCVRFMEEAGDSQAKRWGEDIAGFHKLTEELTSLDILRPWQSGREFFRLDPSKLVISCAGTATTGPGLMDRFRQDFNIELEMASRGYVVAMTGMGDTAETLRRFAAAILEVDREIGTRESPRGGSALFFDRLPQRMLRIKEAAGRRSEPVPMEESAGRVIGEYIWAYPPGIPMVVPGETMDREMLMRILELGDSGVRLRSTHGNVPGSVECLV